MTEMRERVLVEADRLLAERSYNGFSYAHLARSLGVRKPSIHYYFSKKEALVVEIVEVYTRGFGAWIERESARAPGAQLWAYFELFEGFVKRGHGCPTATLSAEYGTLPDPVVRALLHLMSLHVEWLAGVLERGRERGELRFEGSAAQLAKLVASTVQGAVLSARALGPHVYVQVTRSLAGLLGLHPPGALEAEDDCALSTK